jgi:hypothetical protein
MISQSSVTQQFYGSASGGGKAGLGTQLTHTFDSETDTEPFEFTLGGLLPNGSFVNITMNGLGLTPKVDFNVVVRGGVSIVEILIPFDQLMSGDIFVINA